MQETRGLVVLSLVAAALPTVPYIRLDILVTSVLLIFAFDQLNGLVLPRVHE